MEDIILTEEEKAIIILNRKIEAEKEKYGEINEDYINFFLTLEGFEIPAKERVNAIIAIAGCMVCFCKKHTNVKEAFEKFAWDILVKNSNEDEK